MVIQRLLIEAGAGAIGDELVSVDARGFEVGRRLGSLKSPENYVGYERTEGFASPGGAIRDKPHIYEPPARMRLNDWALSGDWTMVRGAIVLNKPNGRIAYRFHARDLASGHGAGRARQFGAVSRPHRWAAPGRRLTERMSTPKATARWPSSGCISWSGSQSPSPTDCSRSSFSTRASRPLRSRSDDRRLLVNHTNV